MKNNITIKPINQAPYFIAACPKLSNLLSSRSSKVITSFLIYL